MTKYHVFCNLTGKVQLICARPYPRVDHLDPYGWETKAEAQAFADRLSSTFPENSYEVKEAFHAD